MHFFTNETYKGRPTFAKCEIKSLCEHASIGYGWFSDKYFSISHDAEAACCTDLWVNELCTQSHKCFGSYNASRNKILKHATENPEKKQLRYSDFIFSHQTYFHGILIHQKMQKWPGKLGPRWGSLQCFPISPAVTKGRLYYPCELTNGLSFELAERALGDSGLRWGGRQPIKEPNTMLMFIFLH